MKARKYQHNTPEKTDSELDCGYEGGVNCNASDDENLAELEGDEMEANLSALHKMAESQDAPNAFKQMMSYKGSKEWKEIEANRALGYTKNSTHTQERRKEAQG